MWTEHLADFIVNTSTDDVDDEVRSLATQPIIDTIGVMHAGLNAPAGEAVLRYGRVPAGWGLRPLWGTESAPIDAETKAIVGGTIGHAMDFDDVSGYGHPSAILLGTILSLDDIGAISGRALLDAFLVGYEVSVEIAKALGTAHYNHGWHTTCTAGSFAALAAAARFYELDFEQARRAIGIAASMAGGLQRNFGSMTKPLHSGMAARTGIVAARLARAGLTASEDVLDGERGFIEMYGLSTADPSKLAGLGSPWAMAVRVPTLKKFPSCYSTHRPIAAMLQIQEEHDFRIEDIESIVVRAPSVALHPLLHRFPTTGLEAKFSPDYPLAAAFQDREVTIESFGEEQIRRPELRPLMERMDIREDPRCRPDDPEGLDSSPGTGGFWEVTAHATDGRTARVVKADAPGSPEDPLTWIEIEEKFTACIRTIEGDDHRSADAFAVLRKIDQVNDVRTVLDELDPA